MCRGGFEDVEHVEEDVSEHEAVFALRFLARCLVEGAFVDRAVQEVVVLQLEELGEVVRDEGEASFLDQRAAEEFYVRQDGHAHRSGSGRI